MIILDFLKVLMTVHLCTTVNILWQINMAGLAMLYFQDLIHSMYIVYGKSYGPKMKLNSTQIITLISLLLHLYRKIIQKHGHVYILEAVQFILIPSKSANTPPPSPL